MGEFDEILSFAERIKWAIKHELYSCNNNADKNVEIVNHIIEIINKELGLTEIKLKNKYKDAEILK